MKSCTTKLNKRIKKNTEQLNNATNSSIILSASAVSLIFFFGQEKSTIFFSSVFDIVNQLLTHMKKSDIFSCVLLWLFSGLEIFVYICYLPAGRSVW